MAGNYVRTKEHKELMSKKCSGENNGFFGKQHKEETKIKISERLAGNNYAKGLVHSEETKDKLRKLWKGKNKEYNTPHYKKVHRWIRKELQSVHSCANCNVVEYSNYKLHCANIDGLYTYDLNMWKKLCVSCHHKLDKGEITI